jgi:pSer/pThr/pTyr-binding forkhead associated (FHA) protein
VRKKLILSDGMREREIQLVGRIVVGRDPACEISHDDSLLSRRHAEFVTTGAMVTVRDLGSRNGVFVNGARAAEHMLEPGDIVQIGPLRARFVVEHAPSSITPEELDAERTAVLRRGAASAPPQVSASAPPRAAASVVPAVPPVPPVIEDDDATRLMPAPRMPTPAPRMATPAPHVPTPAPRTDTPVPRADPPLSTSPDDGDDDPTEFISAPEASHLRSVGAAISAEPLYVPPSAPRGAAPAAQAADDVSRFVIVPVLTLASAILAAGALPLAMWRRLALDGPAAAGASVSFIWLALPVAVALIGTYVVAAFINRRITEARAGGGVRNRT